MQNDFGQKWMKYSLVITYYFNCSFRNNCSEKGHIVDFYYKASFHWLILRMLLSTRHCDDLDRIHAESGCCQITSRLPSVLQELERLSGKLFCSIFVINMIGIKMLNKIFMIKNIPGFQGIQWQVYFPIRIIYQCKITEVIKFI